MLLAQYLAFNGLHGIYDETLHVFRELGLKVLLRLLILVELALADEVEERVRRDDIAFFELTIVFAVTLHRIVGQLHIDLIILRHCGIVICVLFRAGAHVAFRVNIDATVRSIEQDPLTYVELAAKVQQWPLNQLLDDEREIFVLLVCAILILVLLLHLLVIVVVRLEDRRFVSCAAANAVVVAHNFAQLIKGLEDMNTDSAIETSGLQEPQVLRVMAALGQLVRRFNALFF